jgi:hypothetical protein
VRRGCQKGSIGCFCTLESPVTKADHSIDRLGFTGIDLARLGAAHLLTLPPMRAKKHEEDRKFDVGLETKNYGGGNRGVRCYRCVCPEERGTSAKTAEYGGGCSKKRKAAAKQQSEQPETTRQKRKKLKRRLSGLEVFQRSQLKPTHSRDAWVSYCVLDYSQLAQFSLDAFLRKVRLGRHGVREVGAR